MGKEVVSDKTILTLTKIECNENMIQKLLGIVDSLREENLKLQVELNASSGKSVDDHIMSKIAFGDRLRYLMKLHKVSGKTIGQYMGLSQKTISRYVTGEVKPDEITQQKLLSYFEKFL